MMRTLTAVVVASLLPAHALAQLGTRRVFVDATTASGRAVVDLRADEFEIVEGGERRDISSAKLGQRPARIVLVVDSTDAIRQPIKIVSLMIGRATGGAYTNISPNGLLEVLERVATVINDSYASTLNYQIDFTSASAEGKKPAAPQVRVLREGVELHVISTP
jgi:hypothetical protein